MKVFEWVPNKSIGDLKFNMSRDEARKAMGDAKYIPLDREGADIYADDRLRLGYDHNGLLESVVFLGNDKGFFEVHYKGKVIYPKYEKHFSEFLIRIYLSHMKNRPIRAMNSMFVFHGIRI